MDLVYEEATIKIKASNKREPRSKRKFAGIINKYIFSFIWLSKSIEMDYRLILAIK